MGELDIGSLKEADVGVEDEPRKVELEDGGSTEEKPVVGCVLELVADELSEPSCLEVEGSLNFEIIELVLELLKLNVSTL